MPLLWALAVTVSCLVCASAAAQSIGLATDLSLETTYVFRGNPQYNTEEIPSLQLTAQTETPSEGDRVFAGITVTSALAQRGANSDLGSSDEFIGSLGGILAIAESQELQLGALGAFRPSNEPVDVRKELFVRFTWRVLDSRNWKIVPYLGLYGEVHRMQGAYGELGITVQRALDRKFPVFARGTAWGGWSHYLNTDERFEAAGGSIALGYEVTDYLEVSGRFSGSISRIVSEFDASDFIEEHGVFWSGIFVSYTPIR